MFDASNIYSYPFYNPQRNFSRRDYRQNPEANFADEFARAYCDRFWRIHYGTSKKNTLFMREVPVSGNGIADLLVFSWSEGLNPKESPYPDLEQLDPMVRAFEFKLSDWRKGMMQAHRYKYFSHASILVLPRHKLKLAEKQLEIFRKLRVGLWGFSPDTGSIS